MELRGLIEAKTRGYNSVMTGDVADELFAGYSFCTTKMKNN
jgi:asparagine synthetase B (glutamine-hydrolysing)